MRWLNDWNWWTGWWQTVRKWNKIDQCFVDYPLDYVKKISSSNTIYNTNEVNSKYNWVNRRKSKRIDPIRTRTMNKYVSDSMSCEGLSTLTESVIADISEWWMQIIISWQDRKQKISVWDVHEFKFILGDLIRLKWEVVWKNDTDGKLSIKFVDFSQKTNRTYYKYHNKLLEILHKPWVIN